MFDDFAAVLKHLIDRGYTSPRHLAIEGGSNGGLLMGATFTQHPELMRVVVSHVGIYDMLRSELSPNGAFNIPEFGTVKQADHFEALYAYTMGGAIASGDSDNRGSITPGKWADLAILSGDPLTAHPDALLDIHVDETYRGGRLVFRC